MKIYNIKFMNMSIFLFWFPHYLSWKYWVYVCVCFTVCYAFWFSISKNCLFRVYILNWIQILFLLIICYENLCLLWGNLIFSFFFHFFTVQNGNTIINFNISIMTILFFSSINSWGWNWIKSLCKCFLFLIDLLV